VTASYLDALYSAPITRAVRRNIVIASPSDSVKHVAQKLIRDDIGAAVIVDEGTIAGIVTEKDILQRVILSEKNIQTTLIKNVMTSSPFTVKYDCSIRQALKQMQQQRIRRLIVIKNGALFGIITERRLLSEINSRVSTLFEHLINQD
jgi:predicted transcriptional regulator